MCGGDGTFHEVVNGMLFRRDKKTIPLGILPNGTGNDFGNSVSIPNIDVALRQIDKANVISINVVEEIVDHESEEALDEAIRRNPEIEKKEFYRYSVINTSFLILSNSGLRAEPWKQYIGQLAYTCSAIVEFFVFTF